ncbi:MAG: cysteine desulfurase family protein [Bacteroidia bacterium]|nr:cysteine desulfurase [Bacteroidia bacterium]MDW8133803.1 cysteine desulfurase family protein [Bacteroidia bacterium]
MHAVYLDYNATTPLSPLALKAMLPYFTERFGNPASPHIFGKEAQDAVEETRALLAKIFDTTPEEWIFTSGATEALNMALQGIAKAYAGTSRRHILVAATEHKAVLDPLKALAEQGWEIEVLSVSSRGEVEPDTLRKALRSTTLMVAVMFANNETGVIQPIAQLAKIAHEAGAFFVCDTTQAVGKIPFSLSELDVDVAVLSAHKFYGPKGIGALYIRRKNPRVLLKPLFYGGGHERGLRSGTLAVPLIVGMGVALQATLEELPTCQSRLQNLRERLWQGIQALYPSAYINGEGAYRLPNTLSVTFPGLKASDLLGRMPLLAVATGSACTSAKPEPSHVLLAMGLTPADAKATLRFSLGCPTTEADIELAIEYLSRAIQTLRPAYAPKSSY